MYSPVLSEKVVKTLYRLKRSCNRPITQIAEELIVKSLNTVEKSHIGEKFIKEKNHDCSNCYLAEKRGPSGI